MQLSAADLELAYRVRLEDAGVRNVGQFIITGHPRLPFVGERPMSPREALQAGHVLAVSRLIESMEAGR